MALKIIQNFVLGSATWGRGEEAKRTKDTEPVNWPLLYWIKNENFSPLPLSLHH
jgi:hypothetical protein